MTTASAAVQVVLLFYVLSHQAAFVSRLESAKQLSSTKHSELRKTAADAAVSWGYPVELFHGLAVRRIVAHAQQHSSDYDALSSQLHTLAVQQYIQVS